MLAAFKLMESQNYRIAKAKKKNYFYFTGEKDTTSAYVAREKRITCRHLTSENGPGQNYNEHFSIISYHMKGIGQYLLEKQLHSEPHIKNNLSTSHIFQIALLLF